MREKINNYFLHVGDVGIDEVTIHTAKYTNKRKDYVIGKHNTNLEVLSHYISCFSEVDLDDIPIASDEYASIHMDKEVSRTIICTNMIYKCLL